MPAWLKRLFHSGESNHQSLPSIASVKDLRGKRVILRASLNTPIKDGVVKEAFRLEQALPTIELLKARGAKVVIIGHIGREPEESLEPVFSALKDLTPLKWSGSLKGATASVAKLKDGDAVLFENLRQDERESAGDDSLAAEIAALGDVYVNDAFSDSHREHASITGLPRHLPSYFGLSFIKEYEALVKLMEPKHPALFILGGAKFETKMPLVERYAKIYDTVYIGGALANDFYKARGYEVGESLVSDIDLRTTDLLTNPKIEVPSDVVVSGDSERREAGVRGVRPHEKILDIGPVALRDLIAKLESAKTILWNGPLGNFEAGFSLGTETLARAVAKSGSYSVVGGGDTVAAIRTLGIADKFSFMSTAGGAMLVFLETGTLPAIEAVIQKG